MPAIQELHEQSPEIIILAINMTVQDRLEDVSHHVEKKQITFDILMDSSGAASRPYPVNALPTSFFIDKEGIIRKVVHKPPPISIL